MNLGLLDHFFLPIVVASVGWAWPDSLQYTFDVYQCIRADIWLFEPVLTPCGADSKEEVWASVTQGNARWGSEEPQNSSPCKDKTHGRELFWSSESRTTSLTKISYHLNCEYELARPHSVLTLRNC